jgi:hypothetical protein
VPPPDRERSDSTRREATIAFRRSGRRGRADRNGGHAITAI